MKSDRILALFLTLGGHAVAERIHEEKYRGNYKPEVIDGELGKQIVAPDTPYVAAAGRDGLYFIDIRNSEEEAAHIKEQIEQASVPRKGSITRVDEKTGHVQNVLAATGEVLFTFDPEYAKIFFASLLNDFDPQLDLEEPEPAGDQLVIYDLETRQAVMTGQDSRCGIGRNFNSRGQNVFELPTCARDG